ncbi:MAG: asparagine synthase (glutamine-hydrolyzing) [Armatimonadetes bacterium]|nr:asparagine synthase (glutamine-hydrolyzing) [Armatimonadota bacterium]
MCGIVGFLAKNAQPDARLLLERMNNLLEHRGPDDAGLFLNRDEGAEEAPAGPQVALAMRRLSIIDLHTGHQPISNEDETCWIVFIGEIYNHQELRRELEGRGHIFRTRTDTEAILHAYEEYGPECVGRLRGMFGFAIWDQPRQRLLLARDPVGIKPLYWTEAGGSLAFASEIKSLLLFPGVGRAVDPIALDDYLTYLYVPPPRTMFQGIAKLPPGHRLIWEQGSLRVEEYWGGPASLLEHPAAEPLAPERVWAAIRESVEAHLLSDVPLGAFLSGGLDSLAVVTAMAEICREPVRTFTVGFENGGLYNELDAARLAAEHFRTEHESLMLGPECVAELPKILWMLDEPLADASVLPNYAVARLARQKVKVALSGAGGDELFGGYQRYRGEEMAAAWGRIPGFLRNGVLLPTLRLLPNRGDTRLGDRVRLAQKFLEPLDLPSEQRYLAWNSFFQEPQKRALGLPNGTGRHSFEAALPHFRRVEHRPFSDRAMYVDLKTYLPGDPLFLADRMTMAHSLESRVPFVDPVLMELAYRLPATEKLKGSVTKAIIREALLQRAPEALLVKPKRGFGTPTDLWLRGPWRPLAEQALAPEALRRTGSFQSDFVQRMLAQHQGGGRDFSQHLWALLVFQLWHALFIEPDRAPEGPVSLHDLGFRMPPKQV